MTLTFTWNAPNTIPIYCSMQACHILCFFSLRLGNKFIDWKSPNYANFLCLVTVNETMNQLALNKIKSRFSCKLPTRTFSEQYLYQNSSYWEETVFLLLATQWHWTWPKTPSIQCTARSQWSYMQLSSRLIYVNLSYWLQTTLFAVDLFPELWPWLQWSQMQF